MRRQANKSAHALAAYAKDIDSLVVWVEDCPPFIESLVIQDFVLFLIFQIKFTHFPLKKKKENLYRNVELGRLHSRPGVECFSFMIFLQLRWGFLLVVIHKKDLFSF